MSVEITALPSFDVSVLNELEARREQFIALRHDLHAHPETAYQEQRTSGVVARELASYGVKVHRGLAGTGVVGVLRHGNSTRSIGLRADLDALNITEETGLPHQSTIHGKMHACGHDGHTTMLLLAARQLSETRRFDGTIVFIFQPAEEGGGGGLKMIRAGLFDRFHVDEVYGLHNIPGIPAGQFAVMPGPMMAAADFFEIELHGKGGHAATPHLTHDPILAGSALVQSLQSLVSRAIDPLEPAVLSVTNFHGGEASNAIPNKVILRGTVRTYSKAVQQQISDGIRRLAEVIALGYGLDVKVNYVPGYPPTINTEREASFARSVLESLVGKSRVLTHLKPMMAAEDFSYMLQARPGAYVWIGNGESSLLHTSSYDFNDGAMTHGAAFWIRLAEKALAR